MQTELVRQLTIEDLSQNAVLDYIDGDIAFANRLRLPHVPHAKPVKIDALKLLICTKGISCFTSFCSFVSPLCTKGTLQVDVNTKTRIIRANEVLCCLPLTVLRNAIGSDDLECKGIAISMNIVRRLVSLGGGTRDKFFYLEQTPVLPIGQKGAQIFELYHKLIGSRIKATDNPYQKGIMSALISAIFYELLGNLDTYCISRNNTMFKQGDLLFNRFIELLSKSKVKVRSVSFYADKLFITTKYLSVICKQVCGKTAFDIINEFIIEDITELLKYSEKSIKEIANYLEFPNLSYFGKYVKAHTGMSPTQYRKHLINKL